MVTKFVFSVITCMICLCASIYADAVDFRATLSKPLVIRGERVHLKYVINRKAGNFRQPRFDKFKILSGPTQKSYRNSTEYHFELLAEKSGNSVISPATADAEGKTYVSNSIKVNIEPDTKITQSPSAKPVIAPPKSNTKASLKDVAHKALETNLYITLKADKDKAVAGEPITVEYKLYVNKQITLTDMQPLANPSFPGFISIEENFKALGYTDEIVNGEEFKTAVLRRFVLIPRNAQNTTLEKMGFKFKVKIPYNPDYSMQDDFETDFTAYSNTVELFIAPLPAPPDNFIGAVGNVKFESAFAANTVRVGETLILRLTAQGNANLNMIAAPTLLLPDGLTSDAPVVGDDFKASQYGIAGYRTFEYTITANKEGEYNVSPFIFSYFVPSTGKFEVFQAPEEHISVKAAIAQQSKQESDNSIFPKNLLNYFAYGMVALALLLFGLSFVNRKKAKASLEQAQSIDSDSDQEIHSHNESAETIDWDAISTFNGKDLAQAIYTIYTSILREHLSIDNAEFKRDTLMQKFSEKQTPDGIISVAMNLFDDLEYIRFAPNDSNFQKSELISKAKYVIERIISEIGS